MHSKNRRLWNETKIFKLRNKRKHILENWHNFGIFEWHLRMKITSFPQSCLGKGVSHENFSLIVGESKAVTKIMIITFKTENNRDRSITLLAVCRVIQPRVYWATIAFHHWLKRKVIELAVTICRLYRRP